MYNQARFFAFEIFGSDMCKHTLCDECSRKKRRVIVSQTRMDSLQQFIPIKSICMIIEAYCDVSTVFVVNPISLNIPLQVHQDTTFSIPVLNEEQMPFATITVSIPQDIRSCLPGLPSRTDFFCEYGLHDDLLLVIIRNRAYVCACVRIRSASTQFA